jgi:hypothetical protein
MRGFMAVAPLIAGPHAARLDLGGTNDVTSPTVSCLRS